MSDPRVDHHLSLSPLIMILRGVRLDEVLAVADALIEGGVRLLEVTMNTEGALPILERLVDRYGDSSEVMIGAGTVLTADQVSDAATVGVEFIVSPNVHADVIQRTRDLELVSMPGFFSPTEAFDALRFGGQYLKCFPAQTLGLGYIRDLKAVLPAPILAVGGVRCDTARATLEWCAGIGVGGSVWGPGMTPEQGLERVRALLAACRGD